MRFGCVVLIGPFVLTGCAGSGKSSSADSVLSGEVVALGTADFLCDPERIESSPVTVVDDGGSDPSVATTETVNVSESGSSALNHVDTAEPVLDRPDVPLIVGGMIGQINGQPIYIEEFFEPIADQLAGAALKSDRKTFTIQAYQIIGEHLRRRVYNELVLSEARSSLTSEQQEIGLRAFLTNVRSEQVRRAGGSEALANQRLREKHGVSLDEYVEQVGQQELVNAEVREKILSRVRVSWREVEQYYRDHYDEFHPEPSIQLRLIGVPAESAEAKETVTGLLESGQPFEVVAHQHSRLNPSKGGLWPMRELPGGINETEPTDWPEMNPVVRDLADQYFSTGEQGIGGPVRVKDYLIWVMVESYEDGHARELYEAQDQIRTKLENQRFAEEQSRYLNELMVISSIEDPEPIVLELVRIALGRWGAAE